ncbi:hypothetical protein V5N11_004689 [Cardamine amara subsp. amara]|uniref:RING-type domain-containing protein n=1 Tax=Cardamine amara subsp. amara TaxID=228776 RepID=A0ABD1BK26_CARAN
MDSKDRDDVESLSKRREMLLKLQQKIGKLNSEIQKSGPSASTSLDLENMQNELLQLLQTPTNTAQDPSKVLPRIHDDLDKVFVVEEVGHSCELCQRDLARDPERLNASLHRLEEACVLACGHVYHFKCLRGTTLDLENSSAGPSCIFCIS